MWPSDLHQHTATYMQIQLNPPILSFVVQIEDLSSQAQIQAAEKFKAPEVSAITGKEAEEETAAADGGEESDGEEVSPCDVTYSGVRRASWLPNA